MSSTRDADAKNLRLIDVRTVDRNIKKGLLTRKDYEKALKALPDVSDKIAPPGSDDDDDLDADDLDTEADTAGAPEEPPAA